MVKELVARRRLSQPAKEVSEKEEQFKKEDVRSEIRDHVERDAWGGIRRCRSFEETGRDPVTL